MFNGRIRGLERTVSTVVIALCALSCAAQAEAVSKPKSSALVKASTTNKYARALSADERSALKALIQKAPRLRPVTLDMSNKQHRDFFTAVNRLAGRTVKNDAEFGRFLDTATASHQKNGAPDPRFVYLVNGARADAQGNPTEVPVGPVTTITSFEVINHVPRTFGASALVSLPNQPQICTQSLVITDEQGNPQGDADIVTQQQSCENVQLYTSASLDQADKYARAVLTVNWVDASGSQHVVTSIAEGSAAPVKIVSTDPNDKNGDKMIKFCFGRQGSDCDYQPSGTSAQVVNLPINGYTTYPEKLLDPKSDPYAAVFISITRPTPQSGGGCILQGDTTSFFANYTTLSADGKTINWADPKVQFPAINSTCMPNGSTVFYNMVMNLDLQSKFPTFFGISSAPDTPLSNAYYLMLPETRIYYSCLVAGTLVEMADGSKKPIETVSKGDMVLDGLRHAVPVKAIFVGSEDRYLAITLASGKVLRASSGHVVMTSEGPRLARMLTAGDRVRTRQGLSKIIAVATRDEHVKVYNLTVGKTNRAKDATFYGDGILVGDNEAQWRYDRPQANRIAEASPAIQPTMSVRGKALLEKRLNRHIDAIVR